MACVCLLLLRNGYSLFCKKYFSKHSASGHSCNLKDASVAWHQLPIAKKKRYQEKASKVGHEPPWLYDFVVIFCLTDFIAMCYVGQAIIENCVMLLVSQVDL